MQSSRFSERSAELVLDLSNIRLAVELRVKAGDELIRTIESGSGTLSDLSELTENLALGLQLWQKEKRCPRRLNDFYFVCQPTERLATIFTKLGERLDQEADRSQTPAQQRDVKEFRQMHGLDKLSDDLFDDIKDYDLADLAKFVDKLAKNSAGLQEIDDDLLSGQSTLLDIPLAMLAQFYLAAGKRFKQLVEYSPPLDY